MDEDNIQAALDAQPLVIPDPSIAQTDGANPQPAPPDPETNEQELQMIEEIRDRPPRQPPPDRQDRGINDAHVQEAPRRLPNNRFHGDIFAVLKTGLQTIYRQVWRWCFWAYFVSLGLLGESVLFP